MNGQVARRPRERGDRIRDLFVVLGFAALGATAAAVLTMSPSSGEEWAGFGAGAVAWLLGAIAMGTLSLHLWTPSAMNDARFARVASAVGGAPVALGTHSLRGAARAGAAASGGAVAMTLVSGTTRPTAQGLGATVLACAMCAVIGALAARLAAEAAAGIVTPVSRSDLGLDTFSGPIGRRLTRIFLVACIVAVVGVVIVRLLPPRLVPWVIHDGDNAFFKAIVVRFAGLLLLGVFATYLFATVLRRLGLLLPSGGAGTMALLRHLLTAPGPRATGGAASVAFMWALLGSGALDDLSSERLSNLQTELACEAFLVPGPGVDNDTAAEAAAVLSQQDGAILLKASLLSVTLGGVDGDSGALIVIEPRQLQTVTAAGAAPFGLSDGVVVTSASDTSELWFTDWGFSAAALMIGGQSDEASATQATARVTTVNTRAPFTMTTPATVQPLLSQATPVYLLWTSGGEPDEAQRLAKASGGALVVSELRSALPYDDSAGALAIFLVISMVLGAGGAASQALQVTKRSLDVRATLLALGARPRSLAAATAADAAVLTALAGPVGLAVGAVAVLLSRLPLVTVPGAPFPPETLWVAGWFVESWNVGALIGAILLSTGIAALTAWLLALRTAGKAPVDQLKEAIKEGAL